jgi:hypothetical protein
MSDRSKFPRFTIMIPPLPPGQMEVARNELRKKIKQKGFIETLVEMMEDFYHWKDDPDSVSAWRKKRATLIFSKKELGVISSMRICKIIDDPQFLVENISKP